MPDGGGSGPEAESERDLGPLEAPTRTGDQVDEDTLVFPLRGGRYPDETLHGLARWHEPALCQDWRRLHTGELELGRALVASVGDGEAWRGGRRRVLYRIAGAQGFRAIVGDPDPEPKARGPRGFGRRGDDGQLRRSGSGEHGHESGEQEGRHGDCDSESVSERERAHRRRAFHSSDPHARSFGGTRRRETTDS